MGAQQTLVMVQKIILTGKPDYLSTRLKARVSRSQEVSTFLAPIDASLGTTRSSFLYRGIKLYNRLPEEMKKRTSFKTQLKKWILGNIGIKP